MHKKSASEQRVGIMTFCQYYIATYIFQGFIIFIQPTGGLAELLIMSITYPFFFLEQIRALQTCNFI